jgi:Ca-activated chloride channel family protein
MVALSGSFSVVGGSVAGMAMTKLLVLILFSGIGVGLIWIAKWQKLRWWQSLAVRLFLLIVVGAAALSAFESKNEFDYDPEILILDRSKSIQEESLFNSQVFATVWQSLRPNRQVIVYGSASEYVLSDNWPEVPNGGSNLDEALEMAAKFLNGQSGRIIIATDGVVDSGNRVDQLVDQLYKTVGRIDFISLDGVEFASDVLLEPIKGSTNVWSEMKFPIFLPVHSILKQEGELQVYVNGELYNEGQVQLGKGETIVPIMLQAGNPGVMHIEARIQIEGDEFLGNNIAYTSIQVYKQPRILIITKDLDSVGPLATDLRNEGSEVTIIKPDEFPTSLDDLETLQVIFLHNLLEQDLNYEQKQALRLHVLELGKGLVFLGGRNSYTLGGYQNSILEPLMPIILIPPDRVQRVPITFLLVLDRSGSMAGDRDTEIAPIDLTREAAMRAIETLRSDDFLGVLSFSGTTNWEVDLRQVGEGLDLRIAQDKVSQMVASGGTFMYQALEGAVNQMIASETTDYPHILLMSDGVSGDGSSDEFNRLVEYARDYGITISTIALGYESDPETLSRIAERGGGRFYQVYNPEDLPKVMISESRAVQAENVQEGRTNMILGVENHPILAGFRLDELPLLNGYIAIQSKSSVGAEDVLLSGNFGDPLLSVWQVGLGHVAAWMGDLGEQWTPGMKDWEKQGTFWQQVARYVLPDPSIREADVKLNVDETQMKIHLIFPGSEIAKNIKNPIWVQSTDGEPNVAYQMTQISAREYALELPPPHIGAYTGIIKYSDGSNTHDLIVPFSINYPDEWKFETSEVGANRIAHWREKTNGVMLSFDQELENSRELDSKPGLDWFNLLLLILIIGWPVEIAIRRWHMPWRRP